RHYAARFEAAPVQTYGPNEFDRMIADQHVDTVIVTSVDRTHHRYIIRAMELGCDVITEKPMTVDARKCQEILDCREATERDLKVTFNYRYTPHHAKIKEILQSGAIGKILSVHFEWLLDTVHGADYFRRWHRDKRNSGGLMVHKATHHFDLINWWLDAAPETVFGFGSLAFYGRANAEERGETRFYTRCQGNEIARNDPWAIHMEGDETLRELYLNAEHEDGYIRDQSVFGDNISIEDDMAVLVRYNSGATMSYHLTAYAPWEGYRVMFSGTKGRLEALTEETSYVSGSGNDVNRPDLRNARKVASSGGPQIILRGHWEAPVTIEVPVDSGGHGGGDARLLEDLFGAGGVDPLKRAAGHIDGARSILTGIAANQSFATGRPVTIADLITWPTS
ncbi:MAG: Gfo/Idh/MocA family oxidoreductase, partial [Chloroflexota bacterium]